MDTRGGRRDRVWLGAATVDEAKEYVLQNADNILRLVNAARERYAMIFTQEVKPAEDLDNLVVDEILGSRVAEMIAATEPGRTYSQATFHLLDVLVSKELVVMAPERYVALDDLLAGLAAGFEAILPGWAWMENRPAT